MYRTFWVARYPRSGRHWDGMEGGHSGFPLHCEKLVGRKSVRTKAASQPNSKTGELLQVAQQTWLPSDATPRVQGMRQLLPTCSNNKFPQTGRRNLFRKIQF